MMKRAPFCLAVALAFILAGCGKTASVMPSTSPSYQPNQSILDGGFPSTTPSDAIEPSPSMTPVFPSLIPSASPSVSPSDAPEGFEEPEGPGARMAQDPAHYTAYSDGTVDGINH